MTVDSEAGEGVTEPPLPETSILAVEDYLAMQRAIGDETRFRILRTLIHNGDVSASELRDVLDVRSNRLHYHLDELVDVGLVQKRTRSTADQNGLFTYYRASAMGEAIIEHGVEELIRREAEFRREYARDDVDAQV